MTLRKIKLIFSVNGITIKVDALSGESLVGTSGRMAWKKRYLAQK